MKLKLFQEFETDPRDIVVESQQSEQETFVLINYVCLHRFKNHKIVLMMSPSLYLFRFMNLINYFILKIKESRVCLT